MLALLDLDESNCARWQKCGRKKLTMRGCKGYAVITRLGGPSSRSMTPRMVAGSKFASFASRRLSQGQVKSKSSPIMATSGGLHRGSDTPLFIDS